MKFFGQWSRILRQTWVWQRAALKRRRRMNGKRTVLYMQQKDETDRGTPFGWNVDICTRV